MQIESRVNPVAERKGLFHHALHRTASIGSWCLEMSFDEKLELHVSLLGDWSVGKTSIIRRFVFDQFDIQKGELEGIDYE